MEEQVRKQIKEKSIFALESKLAFLTTATDEIKNRNEQLKNLPFIHQTQLSEKNVDLPNQEILKQYFDSKARFSRSKRIYSNLKKANEQLNDRLKKGENLLNLEKEKERYKYIQMLSPTAAKILNPKLAQKTQQKSSSIQGQQLESSYLKKQLQAIEELRNGAVPKPRGTIDINFDELIDKENRKLDQIRQMKKHNKNKFSRLLKDRMNESNTLQESIQNHSKFANSFAEFQAAYNSAADNIDALPFRSLLNILREESSRNTREGLETALRSLEKEKSMIIERLEKMGVDDEESADLKHEIQVKLLHLAHVTATAEKGLCKLSARTPPVDPLETIKIENTEMELEE